MSDGVLSIDDAPLWSPTWDAVKQPGARFVVLCLWVWSDGRGSCDPTMEDIAAFTGLGVSTVRAHIAWLDKNRFLKRKPGPRDSGTGQAGANRYWLALEKLGLDQAYRQKLAVGPEGGEPVDELPPDTGGSYRQISAPSPDAGGSYRQISALPPDAGGSENEGAEDRAHTGAPPRGGARPSSPSLSSPSLPVGFSLRDESLRQHIEQVLDVCGPGLAELDTEGLLDSLADLLPGWMDRFGLDAVITVVKRNTRYERERRVWSFSVFEKDLVAHHAAQQAREARKASKGSGRKKFEAPPVDPAVARRRKIAGLKNIIGAIEAGDYPLHLLPQHQRSLRGEQQAQAFARVLADSRAELQQLQSEGV